MNFLKLGFAKE